MTTTLLCLILYCVSIQSTTQAADVHANNKAVCPLGWTYAEQQQLCQKEIYFSGPVWTQARQFCERLNATFALITINPEDKTKTPVCELPSSASSASGDDAPPAAPAHSDPQKPESSDGDTQHGGTDDPVPVEDSTETNTDCTGTLSTWKCRSLKTLRACKAGQRLQNVQKNCAKTCGFCQ